LSTARVLALVSYRPEYRHGWSAYASFAELHLEPLPAPSAEELVGALVGADPALESVRRLLSEKTEGNPFFLEESIRTLVETGALVGERGAYRLAPAPRNPEMPASVRAGLAPPTDRPR